MSSAKCYLIITTSLKSIYDVQDVQERMDLYKHAISNTLKFATPYPIIPIIVENNGTRETILDLFECKIVYTDNNTKKLHHKGMNEMEDIQHVIKSCNIHDDDMIIKITGRYFTFNGDFYKEVIQNIESKDAIIKFYNVATRQYEKYDSILGLFALRCKYLKHFSYTGKEGAEIEFSKYVHTHVQEHRIKAIRKLGVECCFAISNEILQL
jgi:hypothetical protein